MSTQTELTAAQQHADFLAAVGEHLRAHPDLTVPWIRPDTEMQIPVADERGAGSFAAWCRSLDVHELRVRLFEDFAHVHTVGASLGDAPIKVWAGVPGLQRHLVQGSGYGGLSLTVAELEHFAEHGALPEAGGR